jgi:hypothetical protein
VQKKLQGKLCVLLADGKVVANDGTVAVPAGSGTLVAISTRGEFNPAPFRAHK